MGDWLPLVSSTAILSVALSSLPPGSQFARESPVKDFPLSLSSLGSAPGLIKTWAIMAVQC